MNSRKTARLLFLIVLVTAPALGVGRINAQTTSPATASTTVPSRAQTVRMKVLFAGTEAGHTVFDRKADGSFTATAELTIGALKLGGGSRASSRATSSHATTWNMTSPGSPPPSSTTTVGS